MPYVLRREIGNDIHSFSMNSTCWQKFLQLAQLRGWKPIGTSLIDGDADLDDKIESYIPNDGQVVTAVDAAAWAEALEDALADIPDHDAVRHKMEVQIRDGKEVLVAKPEMKFNLFEAFSGSNKKLVKDFIWFCEQGSFNVW